MAPLSSQSIDMTATDTRRAKWRGAIEQELQVRIQEAGYIREQINASKTQAKKTYFEKKFKKVSTNVMQMVSALQRLGANEAATTAAAVPTEPTAEAQLNTPAESDESTSSTTTA